MLLEYAPGLNGNARSNLFADIYLSNQHGANAYINNQGQPTDRRTNLFSEELVFNNQTSMHRNIITEDGESELFTYFAKADNFQSRLIPRCHVGDHLCDIVNQPNSIYNFLVDYFEGNEDGFPCESIGPRIGSSELVYNRSELPFEEYSYIVNQVLQEIDSNSISFSVKNSEIQFTHDEVINYYAELNDFSGLLNYLNEFGDYFLPIKYGTAVKLNNFELASIYLTQIDQYSSWEPFILPQELYLEYL